MIWRSIRLAVANCTGSNSIEIGDLLLKVRVTVTQHQFFYIFVNFPTVDLSLLMSDQIEIRYVASLVDKCLKFS